MASARGHGWMGGVQGSGLIRLGGWWQWCCKVIGPAPACQQTQACTVKGLLSALCPLPWHDASRLVSRRASLLLDNLLALSACASRQLPVCHTAESHQRQENLISACLGSGRRGHGQTSGLVNRVTGLVAREV